MYSKFNALPDDKKHKILNAAMLEFSQKGYKSASTDNIALNARISKGSLFAYFGTKKMLYLYLHNHVMEIILNYFLNTLKPEPDYLKRMKDSATIKFSLLKNNPAIFDYLLSMIYEKDSTVEPDLREKNTQLISIASNQMKADYDKSLFRNDIDISKAMSLISWTLDGFSKTEQEKITKHTLSASNPDFDSILKELDSYIDLLRKLLYKI